MGGVVVKEQEDASELEKKSYHIVRNFYEYLKTLPVYEDDNSVSLLLGDEVRLGEYLNTIYEEVLSDSSRSPGDEKTTQELFMLMTSMNPCMLFSTFTSLDDARRQEIKRELKSVVEAECKVKTKKTKKSDPDSYSKSFGGTAEDSRVEREAAALLRGDTSGEKEKDSQIIVPKFRFYFEEVLLRSHGTCIR